MSTEKSKSGYYENQANPCNFAGHLALKIRKKMYAKLLEITNANSNTKILDVGVTNDRRTESNFLEKLYPYRENIIAAGLEDASFLEKEYHGIQYIKADGIHLPFADKTFDLVTSFAVIEHVGSRDNQRRFMHELCRVGKSCIITTPNRWHPLEVHTMVPIIHWLPPKIFRNILSVLGKAFYAEEQNLNLLDAEALRRMIPGDMMVSEYHYRFLGIISNLFFFTRHV